MIFTCVGIAVLVLKDGYNIKVFAKEGQSSHDELMHEMVPVEQHNNVLKLEYIFPNLLRVDCPDEECKKRFTELGLVETQFGVLRLKSDIESEVRKSISPNLFTLKTLQGANLRGANLTGANLRGANLIGANLTRTYLRGADLTGANLRGANLTRANLTRANLKEANLIGADLTRTYLIGANLKEADLSKENLEYAKSQGAIIL